MLVGVFTLDNASDGFLVLRAHQLVVATRLLPLLWSALSLLRATATVPGGWAGAERCPDGADLAERVAAILGSDPFGAAPAQTIEGTVERHEGRWRARLYVRVAGEAQTASREFTDESPDCAAVTTTIALAVALSIDPAAATRPPARGRPRDGAARGLDAWALPLRATFRWPLATPIAGVAVTVEEAGRLGPGSSRAVTSPSDRAALLDLRRRYQESGEAGGFFPAIVEGGVNYALWMRRTIPLEDERGVVPVAALLSRASP